MNSLIICFLSVALTGAFTSMHVFSKSTSRLQATNYDFALLFDCDGVILETEELHRLAYNKAFKDFDLTIDDEPVEWSVEYYDVLENSIGGGKPKMFSTSSKQWVGNSQWQMTNQLQRLLKSNKH